MELDAMQARWAEQDRALAEVLRLNREVLRRLTLARARHAMQWGAVAAIASALPALVCMMWLGGFAYDHRADPRFWVPGLLLDVYAIALLVMTGRLVAAGLSVDYSQKVAAIQKGIETARMARIRLSRFAMFTAALVWCPMLIVAAKGLLGVDVYLIFGSVWIVWNLVVGLAAIPALVWAAREVSRRAERKPGFFRELMEDAGGHSMKRARKVLREIEEWEA